MIENRHVPILLKEVVEAFKAVANQSTRCAIVDGTLGGGGHTKAILSHYKNLSVLGVDADPLAIARVQKSHAAEIQENRLALFHGNFKDLLDAEKTIKLSKSFQAPWGGLLLDLGFSSNQLEDTDFGLSFQTEGPLDMRLSKKGTTAWDMLNQGSARELADIFWVYGEVPGARRLAEQIVSAVQQGIIKDSTLSLARYIESIQPRKPGARTHHPATLVFQALRIAVNDELRVLDEFLEGVMLNLTKGAIVAIITFHSLEDRLVKQWTQRHSEELKSLSRKPIMASEEEVAANPRSRSAKLRILERT